MNFSVDKRRVPNSVPLILVRECLYYSLFMQFKYVSS